MDISRGRGKSEKAKHIDEGWEDHPEKQKILRTNCKMN